MTPLDPDDALVILPTVTPVEHATILLTIPTLAEVFLCAMVATIIWATIMACIYAKE